MKGIFILFMMLSVISAVHSQRETETINKQLEFTGKSNDNLLILRNINGSVEIESYNGDKIVLALEKTIIANDRGLRTTGMEEVDLGVIEKENVILVYMANPCYQIDPSTVTAKQLTEEKNRWSWRGNCDWKPRYDYLFDYKLKVPENINLAVSTVNEGDILVKDVLGQIEVNNVNGSITLDGISKSVEAHTINGDLDVAYTKNPFEDSSYYTLNGDINVYFKDDLAANVTFKSFNGEMFTDIENINSLEPVIEKKKVSNEKGISIKIGRKKGFKVGNGGPALDFETFNGDAYLYVNKMLDSRR